jgi:hypothetical protein
MPRIPCRNSCQPLVAFDTCGPHLSGRNVLHFTIPWFHQQKLLRCREPSSQPQEVSRTVRVDSGIKAGGAVSPFYDPMLAKLIVRGEDRPAALALLEQSLRDFQVDNL